MITKNRPHYILNISLYHVLPFFHLLFLDGTNPSQLKQIPSVNISFGNYDLIMMNKYGSQTLFFSRYHKRASKITKKNELNKLESPPRRIKKNMLRTYCKLHLYFLINEEKWQGKSSQPNDFCRFVVVIYPLITDIIWFCNNMKKIHTTYEKFSH